MARQLTVLVPGLLDPPDGAVDSVRLAGAEIEALTDFLNQAAGIKTGQHTFDGALFELFGLSPHGPLPIAPLTRLADCCQQHAEVSAAERVWLRADPVHLRADRDSVVLLACIDDISSTEADALTAQINDLFIDEGWRIEAPQPQRWYIQLASPPDLGSPSPQSVLGRNILDALPRGKDSRYWLSVINECQMLLHQSVVNQQRQQRGALTINSLWLWGAGRLPPAGQCDWQQVWADHPLAIGLARYHDVGIAGLPESAEQWLEQAGTGEHLLVMTEGQTCQPMTDPDHWRIFIESFSQRWVAPLHRALRDGQLEWLVLLPMADRAYRLHAGRRRWWRSWLGAKSLAEFLD